MGILSIFALALASLIAILALTAHSLPWGPPRRRACAWQFARANDACARLPYVPAPPRPPPSPPAPTPAPGPGSPPSHHHKHRHQRRRLRRHDPTPEQEDCCHWLGEIKNECVCDLLVRLPAFLAKPFHNITVVAHPDCDVTFSCPGRLLP